MHRIKEIVESKIKEHNYLGLVSVYKDNEEFHVSSEGFNKDTVFTFYKYDEFFITTLLLILLEQNNIDLNCKIDKYLPELRHSNKVSFMSLLRFSTGLKDYMGNLSSLRVEDINYKSLSEEKQLNIDFNFSYSLVDYNEAIRFYNETELSHIPGSEVDYGDATRILGIKIIERISNKNYFSILSELMFKPLNIKYETNDLNKEMNTLIYYNRRMGLSYNNLNDFIGLKSKDIHNIYLSLKNGILINKKTFKEMTKIIDFNGINFLSGYSFAHVMSICRYNIIDYKNTNMQIIFLSIFSGYVIYQEEEFLKAEEEIVKGVVPVFHKIQKPKLIKLNKDNVYDLFEIKNSAEKAWYMGPTKYMLAYAFAEKNANVYLIKDQNITIGTITLYIDKKSNNYYIANILIDKKYQNSGYGKKAIILSYDIFKKHGAKRVTLFLDKTNVAAFHTYLKAGFKIQSAYARSYEMYIDL